MATTINPHRLLPIFLLIVAYSAHAAGVSGDPPPTGDFPEVTYRTHANEVRLTFSASDQNHHGVATLQAADFAVVDKELVVRNFQSFTRSDVTKLDIAILIDGSESLAPSFRRETSNLVELLAQTAGVPEENLSVFFVGSKPALLCAASCRGWNAAEHLPAPHAGELTPLFDTIIYASNYLAQHAERDAQKILIVLSDGQDTASLNSFRDARDSALHNALKIYSIDLNHDLSSQGSSVLFHLAGATGGSYFAGPNATTRATDGILEDFKASYVITYKLPSNDSGFHDLRIVPTHNLNLQFRSRSGYYYPDNSR